MAINDLLVGWDYFVMVYYLTINLFSLVLVGFAFKSVRQETRYSRIFQDKEFFRHGAAAAPVSILVPAYNEEVTVVENIYSLLSLNYPEFEVVVVNDGSKDSTLRRVVEQFHMKPAVRARPHALQTQRIREIYLSPDYPNLVLVDKENGGKADALNVGINVSRNPLVAAIDTDSILERNVLLKLARPFIENPDTVAVGGAVRVVNGCRITRGQVVKVGIPRLWVARLQMLEYLRAILFGRAGWGGLGMLMIISGAFGMFRKRALVEVGGFLHETVGEDMELVVRLHHHFRSQNRPYHVQLITEAVCWTEVPESLSQLGKQRDRWQRGLLDSLFKHREMLLNPRYGRIGLVAMPYFVFFEGLGPLMEIFGLVAIGVSVYLDVLPPGFIPTFLMVAVLLGITTSLLAVVLEEISFHRYPSLKMTAFMILVAVLENLGYRQLNSWWRLKGTINYLRGNRQWGEMKRKGFSG